MIDTRPEKANCSESSYYLIGYKTGDTKVASPVNTWSAEYADIPFQCMIYLSFFHPDKITIVCDWY